MPDGREVADSELLDVAKDEERARSLRRALRALSTGADPKLREMANGVLRGELSPQQAFTDPEYTAALFSGAAEVRRAGERRSEAEAREAGERFGAWQAARRDEVEDESVGANAVAEDGTSREDGAERRAAAERSAGPAGPWGSSNSVGLGGSRLENPFGRR
ncbi:hypothetical protein ABZ896_47065 [Streptomyces sp. NPDC047072]|uniref:hypothetical protein n=1 Tax=Streptomyces sp. NPDC047072 TaxID=3154809 RepID=UPI0033E4B223